jgi:hypothetical protein
MYYLIRLAVLLFLLVGTVGCRNPESQVRTVDDRPQIAVQDAPKGSILYVDGVQFGPATDYSPKTRTLILEPGTHQVIVRAGSGSILLEETIFLGGGELKVLKIH